MSIFADTVWENEFENCDWSYCGSVLRRVSVWLCKDLRFFFNRS